MHYSLMICVYAKNMGIDFLSSKRMPPHTSPQYYVIPHNKLFLNAHFWRAYWGGNHLQAHVDKRMFFSGKRDKTIVKQPYAHCSAGLWQLSSGVLIDRHFLLRKTYIRLYLYIYPKNSIFRRSIWAHKLGW